MRITISKGFYGETNVDADEELKQLLIALKQYLISQNKILVEEEKPK